MIRLPTSGGRCMTPLTIQYFWRSPMNRFEFWTTRSGLRNRVSERFRADDRPVAVEQHDRRRGEFAVFILDRDRRPLRREVRNARICRAQIDPDGMGRRLLTGRRHRMIRKGRECRGDGNRDDSILSATECALQRFLQASRETASERR